MNEVFGITQKSVNFFLNMFHFNTIDENSINRYIEVEYKPRDRQWAYSQIKTRLLKKI